jgi:hypothetical protein
MKQVFLTFWDSIPSERTTPCDSRLVPHRRNTWLGPKLLFLHLEYFHLPSMYAICTLQGFFYHGFLNQNCELFCHLSRSELKGPLLKLGPVLKRNICFPFKILANLSITFGCFALERFIHFYPANGANQPSLYAVG